LVEDKEIMKPRLGTLKQLRYPAPAALAVILLYVLPHSLPALGATVADEPFIGWQGDSYRPKLPLDPDEANNKSGTPRRWIETISWEPRAYVFHNFLTIQEADHIVSLVEHAVHRSSVIDTKTGNSMLDPIRTSYGGAITRGQDATVAAIEQRIAEWTRLPPDYGEPIQVLRYMDGQKYDAHWDWFDDPVHGKNNTENRVATVLLYLGNVTEGGETSLPLATPIDWDKQRMKKPSECAKKGTMAVVPNKGDALLFWDMLPNGQQVDRRALHASCPTLKGTKWTATKWLHNRPYGYGYDPLKKAAECTDVDKNCKELVAQGKCDSDPVNMLGLTGKCRKSCEDCVDCAADDIICLRKNMRSQRLQRTLRKSLKV